MNRDYVKRMGKMLKQLRETHGYTQTEIASAANISQPAYSNIENGLRSASSEVLYHISSYYGMLTDELLSYCIDLDDDIYYEKNRITENNREQAEYLAFTRLKKYAALAPGERDLLFNFSKLDDTARDEIIDYVKFKRSRKH